VSVSLAALLAFLASPPAAAEPAPDPAHLAELVRKAERLRLAEDPAWLRLGHWRPRVLGGLESEADGRGFFRSPKGRTDPAAELAATLRGFFEAGPFEDELDDAQCRFPARFAFLASRLGFDLARLPPRRCPRLEDYLARLAPRSVTLVFSSYYLNNPASAFGHTFLRVNKADSAREGRAFELLDYAVDYSATVNTSNTVLYAVKGLFGLFQGRFNHYAYYYKVREYADAESRDLWEYDLALSPGEVAMLVAHIWELGGTFFDYWYLDENCSYHVLGAVEAAAPRVELLSHVGRAVVLPSDTVKAFFRNPGLVGEIHYRPSIRTQLAARVAALDGPGLRMLGALADDPAAAFPPALVDGARMAALDAAIDLVDLRHARDLAVNAAPEAARSRQVLLERRSAIRLPSVPLQIPPPSERAPERGHGSARAGAGAGWSSGGGAIALLDVRLALHDLADPPAGYPPLAQIEFLPARLRFLASERRVELDEAWLVQVVSLNDLSRFDLRPSWRMRFGAATVRDGACRACVAGQAEMGAGFALAGLAGALDLYGGLDVALEAAGRLEGIDGAPVRAGVGPGGLARFRLGPRATVLADARLRWLPGSSPASTWDLRGTLRLHVSRVVSLSFEGRRTPSSLDASAAVLAYF
jgi:hypothetical protein